MSTLAQGKADLERASTAQKVADMLRERVLDGELEPGLRLSEEAIGGALGVSRNSARGAGQLDLSSRLSWGFSFGKKAESQGAGGRRVRVIRGDSDSSSMLGMIGSMPGADNKRFRTEFFLQATNVINKVNLTGFSGVQTSPFFGQAIAALPGRRIETGMRFSF